MIMRVLGYNGIMDYGEDYKEEIEHVWIKMKAALSEGEKVHIVAYNPNYKYINEPRYQY